MAKKVSIKSRKSATAADAWVKTRETVATGEEMKRLTIDVSKDLHKRIKTYCAVNDVVMADKIREILEREFPPVKG